MNCEASPAQSSLHAKARPLLLRAVQISSHLCLIGQHSIHCPHDCHTPTSFAGPSQDCRSRNFFCSCGLCGTWRQALGFAREFAQREREGERDREKLLLRLQRGVTGLAKVELQNTAKAATPGSKRSIGSSRSSQVAW